MPKKLFTTTGRSTPSTLSTTAPSPPSSAIPQTFLDNLPLPTLFVFDLDYTLWPFWVDTHVSGPLKPASRDPSIPNTKMVDRFGESFTFYPGVPSILHAARERGIAMSLASRTHAPDLAREMLRGLIVTPATQLTNPSEDEATKSQSQSKKEKPLRALDYFNHMQIFPGSKTMHFLKIQDATRRAGKEIAFAEMLFFDDEARNRNVEVDLGVTFHLVKDGVTKDEVDRGVWEWRRRKGIKKGHTQQNSDGDMAELEG